MSLQSCLTLCDPIDGSPPGSPVPGVLQARTLEWVVISFSNAWKWKVKVNSLSRVWLLVTPWTAAYQAPPSMGFSRQEYWSGVPLPSPKYINITPCINRTKEKSHMIISVDAEVIQWKSTFIRDKSCWQTKKKRKLPYPDKGYQEKNLQVGTVLQEWNISSSGNSGSLSVVSDSLQPHRL